MSNKARKEGESIKQWRDRLRQESSAFKIFTGYDEEKISW